MNKRRIVVLGAGFGGLRAALLLSKKIKSAGLADQHEVFLVDRNDYHTYTPTLYEAATTSKETANYLDLKKIVTFSIEEIAKSAGVRFINNSIEKLDLVNGDIHCAGGPSPRQSGLRPREGGPKLRFDYLVLALGSEVNYFGIPGMEKNALTLKTFLDALKIRDAIVNEIAAASLRPRNDEGVKIVIGGGGSTGVELAGEIKEWLCRLEKELGKCGANVKIVEAAPTALPGFDKKLVEKVEARLKKLGIEIINNEIIAEVKKGKAKLKSGKEIPFDLFIWTGGVKASALMTKLPLKIEKRGRVEVVGEMECLPQTPGLKLAGKIYGIGDAVCFYNSKTGNPIAGVARAAMKQAEVVAHNIMCELKGVQKLCKQYKPVDYPYVIPVGGKWAAAKIGSILIAGFWGWVLKGLVELNYLRSIMPIWKAVRVWLKGLMIFVKNDRLG